jgi:hypothetical protein
MIGMIEAGFAAVGGASLRRMADRVGEDISPPEMFLGIDGSDAFALFWRQRYRWDKHPAVIGDGFPSQ